MYNNDIRHLTNATQTTSLEGTQCVENIYIPIEIDQTNMVVGLNQSKRSQPLFLIVATSLYTLYHVITIQ